MNFRLAGIGAILVGLSVALGAVAAHALEKVISEHYLQIFKLAAQYQMYSGLGLLGISWIKTADLATKWPVRLILLGTTIFAGSLYILALNEILSEKLRMLGAITPIGGVCMIWGWLWLGVLFLKKGEK